MRLNLHHYQKKIDGKKCKHCGEPLGRIRAYEHDGGWKVDGFDRKQWLYTICPNCEYQWALWKLGIPRDRHGGAEAAYV